MQIKYLHIRVICYIGVVIEEIKYFGIKLYEEYWNYNYASYS